MLVTLMADSAACAVVVKLPSIESKAAVSNKREINMLASLS
jgi:hypothetical protein